MVDRRLSVNLTAISDLSRAVERELHIENLILWVTFAVIIYIAVRYVMSDGWRLLGKKLCRYSLIAMPTSHRVAEVLLEISGGDLSLVLSLGVLPPQYWEAAKALGTMGVVSLTPRFGRTVLTIEYANQAPFAKYLYHHITAWSILHPTMALLATDGFRADFYLLFDSSCVPLTAAAADLEEGDLP